LTMGGGVVGPGLDQNASTGKSTRVEPKAMQVLLQLARAEGVVNKDRLISAVWSDVFVTDDVLPGCIATLRRAFDDNARKPRVIETIPKSGYRLLLPVEWCNGNGASSATMQSSAWRKPRHKWLLAGAVVSPLLLLGLARWPFSVPPRSS